MWFQVFSIHASKVSGPCLKRQLNCYFSSGRREHYRKLPPQCGEPHPSFLSLQRDPRTPYIIAVNPPTITTPPPSPHPPRVAFPVCSPRAVASLAPPLSLSPRPPPRLGHQRLMGLGVCGPIGLCSDAIAQIYIIMDGGIPGAAGLAR